MSRSKGGKYGGMRDLNNAKRIGRAMRVAPSQVKNFSAVAQSQVIALVKKAEIAQAMKSAGFVDGFIDKQMEATVGTVNLIAVVPMNSSINGRIGAKIRWKSLQVRGRVNPGSTQTVPQLGSLVLVYDRYPQGAIPAVTAMFETDDSGALLNDENRKRFAILKRWNFVVGAEAGATGPQVAQSVYFVDDYVKLKGLECEYGGTKGDGEGPQPGDGLIGDIRKGALYLVTLGNSSSATKTNLPQIVISARTRFADVQG